jgi:rubredoxin
MEKYRCTNCGYSGKEFIFQFNDYGYCIASNDEEPEYIGDVPQRVKERAVREAKIGEPVGCPKCHAWGVNNFEFIGGIR